MKNSIKKDRDMPPNSLPPYFDVSQLLTYLWVFLISFWGGTVHTVRKIKEGSLERFTLSEWIGDIVISGFIGMATFALCKYAGLDEWLTAFCVAVTSHQGTRGLMFFESITAQVIKDKLGVKK